MTWKHDISEALAIAKHNDRRDAITKLLLNAWNGNFFPSPTRTKFRIKEAVQGSPLVKGPIDTLRVRQTFAGVVAYLPLEIRIALLAHYVMGIGKCTIEDVLEAIENPLAHGIQSGGNYKFGWPASRPIYTICEELKDTVDMAESNGVSFDDAYEVYTHIVSMKMQSVDDVDEPRKEAYDFIKRKVSEEMANAVSLVIDEALTTSSTSKIFNRMSMPSCSLANEWLAEELGELAETKPEPVAHSSTTIDAKMIPAIDSLLQSAGVNLNIEALLFAKDQLHAVIDENESRRLKVTELEAKLAAAKSTAKFEVAAAATDALPAGQVVWKNAAKVFGVKGTQAKVMQFDIPTWEWDAPHPWVPSVDEDYIFEPKMLVAYLDALAGGDPVWNYGHTGCGKTTFVEQVAARTGYPVLRVNCDSDIGRLDLVGRDKIVNDGGVTTSTFIDGIVPQALANGCILLVDEFDASRGETAYVLQRVTEMKGLMIAEDGARYVPPHPMFRIAACCNSRGQGDEFGIYPAVRVQSQAVLNRFTVWLEHDYLPAEQETKLLVSKSGIAEELAKKWVGFANGIREAFRRGDVLSVVSPRELVSACQRYVRYGALMDAMEAHNLSMETTFLSKASGNDRAKFVEIAQRVFG